jgi:ATP-dependent Lon protease
VIGAEAVHMHMNDSTTRATLPLISAVAETVLPGEERTLDPLVLGEGAVAWLQNLRPETPLVLVTVTALAEVPLLVTGRFATRVVHQGFDEGRPRFLGQARVKLVSVKGTRVPFEAECDPAPLLPTSRLPELVLHAVAALRHGPPLSPALDITPLAAAALRALGGPHAARQSLTTGDLEQALDQATRAFVAEAPGRAAVTELETHLRTLAQNPTISKALRQRLHSAVIEVSRRLDVYDTQVAKNDDLDELDLLARRIEQGGLPVYARAVAERELRLLRDMKKEHHDYATHLRLLQLMAQLAWLPDLLPPVDLERARTTLDRDHAGLERPKRRILEHLAVRVLGGEGRATVLCLAGPPGVGKTSLARAMAEATGRPFVRVALGGVYDQSELRGHRITYTAARPGRIVDGLANVRSRSALVLLDELDKLGTDRSRDAVGPLLEILDPEQNHSFSDNFLSVPYDLSDCFFVATANDLSRIPDFLRDRLEIIELDGYTTTEKVQIARTHLAAGLAREHGIPPLSVADEVVAAVVEGWTREAGVRQLRRELSALYRARAVEQVLHAGAAAEQGVRSQSERAVVVSDLAPVLGPRRFKPPSRWDKLLAGVATGLSVAAHGGQTLPIEIVRVGTSERAPGRLGMTGSLGAVIKESAETVRAHLMAYRAVYELPAEVFAWDLHLHAPEAAVPKDGPSAGVAIFLAQLSLLTGRPVRPDVAATGELTLSGQVLAVGGVRAKCLAAEQAQMGLVLLPRSNEADVPADLKIPVVFIERAEEALVALHPVESQP